MTLAGRHGSIAPQSPKAARPSTSAMPRKRTQGQGIGICYQEELSSTGMFACRSILFNQLTRLTFSIRKLRDRFVGTLRPFSRHAIKLSPYCQRRCAVARPIPKRQQIAFHGVRSDRAQTSLASSPFEPTQPAERLLHSRDCSSRWWRQTHGARSPDPRNPQTQPSSTARC